MWKWEELRKTVLPNELETPTIRQVITQVRFFFCLSKKNF